MKCFWVVSIVFALAATRTASAQPADAGAPDAPPADAAPPDAPPAPNDAPPADAPPARPPDTPAAPPAQPNCTGSLDGHAVDRKSHEPIAGATVTIDGTYVTETNAEGRFTLKNQCPGDHALSVERADYNAGTRTITLGTSAASVELEMDELGKEVITIEDKAPPPPDMRSTTVLSGEALERTRGRALSESLAEVPGVSQLRSSSGLAKPIVRGQFGRRLLILVDGIRHRAQEWGLDHAPEIDPFIADKLTVVRGAAGVRYGPDAIGGAVLVDPPELLQHGYAGEAHLIGMSNGLGGSFATRLQMAPDQLPGFAWQVEGSYRQLAAPSTPDYALDNTGSRQWNVGATAGYRHHDTELKLSASHYQADLGVCSCLRIESAEDFFKQLQQNTPSGVDLYTSELGIDRPYQQVFHDFALARAVHSVEKIGTFTTTLAFQHDRRREYDVVREDTTGPQFDFRLITPELDVAFEHYPVHLSNHVHVRGSAGVVGVAQMHDYGGLPLVPSHRSYGAGIYAIERVIAHDLELEAGARYDILNRTAQIQHLDFLRLVRSGQLEMDACGNGEADPVECASTFHTVSASVGALYRLQEDWSVKLDLSTASRPPNPDEQFLNGTSPTFPVLGLGKPDLKPETTYSVSATTSYSGDHVAAEGSAYVNYIADYIYFAPAIDDNGEPIFDVLSRGSFPRFVTKPVDAVFFGADGGVAVKPHPQLEFGAQVSLVRAKNLTDDSYLVFVPPDHLRGSVTGKQPKLGSFKDGFVTVSGEYVAHQDRFDLRADFAPPPAAYFLLGAELGAETLVGHQTLKLALQGTNLLNTRYRDYTSLLRYFADQPGWQLMLRASMHWGKKP
ncbi:MAG TPA: TonB-dependent receptor [Kofleriaceae bacterium]|nr:TonB-dependent receptor [Kofleriaceae bacterium]